MDNKKIRAIGAAALVLLWAGLTLGAWFGPREDVSDSERRPLAQMPGLTLDTVLDGSFMSDFADFSLDQFPLRDTFRKVKSLFHYNVLHQLDNNGIYLAGDYAVKQEYPLNETSVEYALKRFNYLYESYLAGTGSQVYMAVIPDKGYYLAQHSGHLAMDYEALFTMVREGMPWASHVDLTDCLSGEDYYFTDTHWRQERLLTAAERLCAAMGVTAPRAEEITVTALEQPFYGVYYGQAALPMDPEDMYLVHTPAIDAAMVTNFETGKASGIYDMDKLTSRDLYDVYLSGAVALMTIENPMASTDRELIVFRDSFGSSMVPLLLQDYAKVTVIDIRYVASQMLGQLLAFNGQDVLFLYSTLVLNSSATLK